MWLVHVHARGAGLKLSRVVNAPRAAGWSAAAGWPQSTSGGSALTTAAAAGATETGAGQMLNVPTPPGRGSACCLEAAAAATCGWRCLLSAPGAAAGSAGDGSGGGAPGFSRGCRKSCVFRKKLLPACSSFSQRQRLAGTPKRVSSEIE